MAEDKKSFILYTDQREHFDQLTDEEAGRLIKHLFAYVNDESPQTADRVTNLSFTSIKSQLKRDLVKYKGKKQQWSDAGKASAEARKLKKEQELTDSTTVNDRSERSTDSSVTVNGNVNDTVNVILLEKETKEFLDFWDLYDKKKGKLEKVAKKFLGLSQAKQKLIMEYIPKYKLKQPNKDYRLNPMTFLNNDGWLDEIITDQDPSKPNNVLPAKFRT